MLTLDTRGIKWWLLHPGLSNCIYTFFCPEKNNVNIGSNQVRIIGKQTSKTIDTRDYACHDHVVSRSSSRWGFSVVTLMHSQRSFGLHISYGVVSCHCCIFGKIDASAVHLMCWCCQMLLGVLLIFIFIFKVVDCLSVYVCFSKCISKGLLPSNLCVFIYISILV